MPQDQLDPVKFGKISLQLTIDPDARELIEQLEDDFVAIRRALEANETLLTRIIEGSLIIQDQPPNTPTV